MADNTPEFNARMQAAREAMLAKRGTKPVPKLNLGEGVDAADIERSIALHIQEEAAKIDKKIRSDLNTVIANTLDTVREHRIVLVDQTKRVERKLDGINHQMFDTLVRAADTRDAYGNRKNIFLKGPMGSGKSTAGKRLSELLELPFGYIGQTNMPHIVVGSQHPINHEYRHTAFTTAFINGGVIMFEEMDAWNPNASLVLNPPLANGWLTLEDGSRHERHPDCIIIACANTWGTGATADYVGRNKLDAAFLDRFAFKIMWGYDETLERRAAGNDEVVDAVQKIRFNAETHGIKVTVSPRSSIDVADAVRAGFSMKEALDMNVLSGVDTDIRRKLIEDVVMI